MNRGRVRFQDTFKLSKPQPNTTQRLGLTIKWLCIHHHPPPTHRNSMSAISQLLLTRFWWNFKGRFLWTFRTDSICQGDICPHNTCSRNICPYQEYLSCYWPDSDETLQIGSLEHLEQIPTETVTFVHATFALATFVHIRNISPATDPIFDNPWIIFNKAIKLQNV